MTPEAAIASLDRMIEQNGEEVCLQRITGTVNQATFSATVRAFVRGYQPQELVGSIVQGDSKVILSPTGIAAAQWPGPQIVRIPPVTTDVRVPTTNDKCVIAGRTRNIQAATPFYLGGQLVRTELNVKG